jgi:hypothetical protein
MENEYVVPTSKEVPEDYGKDLTGKMITFGEGKDMSWGIEVKLDLDPGMREFLTRNGLIFPDRIGEILFVTLSPQESLPEDQRTIRSKNILPSALQYVADSTANFGTFTKTGERPYEYISREFHKVLPSTGDKDRFNETIKRFEIKVNK